MEALQLEAIDLRRVKEITIVGGNLLFSSALQKYLFENGFEKVVRSSSLADASAKLQDGDSDLTLIDVDYIGDFETVIDFVEVLRAGGHQGRVVLATEDPCPMDLLTALKAGVNDYLTKGPYLDLAAELTRLADHPNEERCPGWYPDSIMDMGLFRSLGLTCREMEILSEYARDFPRYRELSKRVNKTELQLRKLFSRIFQKLEGPLAIENPAQLAHLLTVCAIYC